jgi:hypothetical protein
MHRDLLQPEIRKRAQELGQRATHRVPAIRHGAS